jgi:large subunit ribosomal protein L14e
MIEVGRVVIKIAGRDARGVGAIVKVLDDNFVLIDGALRRKKVNIKHIELLPHKINIKEEASKKEVLDELKKLNLITEEEYEYWVNKENKEN